MTRVLAIDDDRQLLRALQITLGARGYEVVPVATGAGALAAASAAPPDVVILDLGLPDLMVSPSSKDSEDGVPPRSPSYRPDTKNRRRYAPSTPARTTMSPSPSGWRNCLPDCVRPYADQPR
jgi:hypothetical protein